tara:strand:+ start:1176 stop:1367 length:192 start_codon:yes stop_codon:yes gene_type:complete
MSVIYCFECDKLVDTDFFGCEEVEGELVCGECFDEMVEGCDSMTDGFTGESIKPSMNKLRSGL